MNRSYYLVIALLAFFIATATLYVGGKYILADSSQQHTIEQNIYSLLPGLVIIAISFAFIVWISALILMLLDPRLSAQDKIVWSIVIVFLHVLGALIYLLISPFYRPNLMQKKTEQGAAANP